MSKGMRMTEKWMTRCLWLVALAFAGFLIGLGGKVVDNLRYTEPMRPLADFIDPLRGPAVRQAMQAAQLAQVQAQSAYEQARLAHERAASDAQTAANTFDNWVRTRTATARPEHDDELMKRTQELDRLRAAERSALAAVEVQRQAMLDASQELERSHARWNELEKPARLMMEQEASARELRIFGYRLALTLPLVAAAGWLFARKRKSQWWPFTWGFIIFALFAFFVELVPYLPSYGGYVRYGVGIVLTVIGGRYAIVFLQRFRERQQLAESLPDTERRATLPYDKALARLASSVCPGCERKVNLETPDLGYCPHCGMGLMCKCAGCSARKSAFAPFCFACGAPDQRQAGK